MDTETAIALREELEQALQAHEEWKHRLHKAIRGDDTGLSASEIGCSCGCRFGRWLQALPKIHRISRDGREVERLHTEFHTCAGAIAESLSRGEFRNAAAALSGEDYNRLSAELERAVSRWHMAAA